MSDLIHEIRSQIDRAICGANLARLTEFPVHLHGPYNPEDIEEACKIYRGYWHVDISGGRTVGWFIDLRRR